MMQRNIMNKAELDKMEDSIRNASPLELASKLREAELYDMKETRTVIDEVYAEFNKQGGLVNEVVVPIFMSIADGLLESTAATRKLRKKGLTASRIVSECKNFSYENPGSEVLLPNAYDEFKNARDKTREYGESVRISYDRKVYDDDSKSYYKKRAVKANGGRKNLIDEYTGERNITAYQNDADYRRNDSKHRFQAQPDHIVPLVKVHEHLKGNYALSDEDIARIANSDSNLALTAARINQGEKGKGGKNDMTNEEFIKDQNRREANCEDNLGLTQQTKDNMLRKSKEARHAIDADTNQTVLKNITGKGTADQKLYAERYEEQEKKIGRSLTKEERNAIDVQLAREKQISIGKDLSKNAVGQAKDYMIGNIIMFLIKPLYYEISDILRNGLKEGVNAETTREALKKRFCRVKDYVVENAVIFLGNSVKDFVIAFVSSLIEGIISLFVGIFKQVLKVVKEGVRILAQSGKVLFGKQSHQISAAEKGDAIVKIIGGGVIAICGIGIEALLNKIGLPAPWSVILSTILSGIASAMFMLLLDKIDLFSVKAEKRRKRIEEIFDARIKDIQDAEQTFDAAAIETMRQQKLQFIAIEKNINDAINKNDISSINTGLFELAGFMNVDLGYRNQTEFVDKFDDMDIEL